MTWSPNEYYRTVFKQGMAAGWDVWAFQIAVNNSTHPASPQLVEDGQFGPKTDTATRDFQSASGITSDGVAGYQTQSTLIKLSCNEAETGLTPHNLVFGVSMGECGGAVAAVTKKYKDGSRDYGLVQENLTEPTQAQEHDAFNPHYECAKAAREISGVYAGFKGKPGCPTVEAAWRLAILTHNWPTAAYAIAQGHGDTFTYGGGLHLSDPAPFVVDLKIPGVTTGWDWCKYYIDTKVAYVTSWNIA